MPLSERQIAQFFLTVTMSMTLAACFQFDSSPEDSLETNQRVLGGAVSSGGGVIDSTADGDSVRAQLEKSDNAISRFLTASAMTDDGKITTDFLEVLQGVSDDISASAPSSADCSMGSARTYILSDDLFGNGSFPRVISTLCKTNKRASEFFIAASFAHRNNALDPSDPNYLEDIDPTNVEMSIWDDEQERNVYYAIVPVEENQLGPSNQLQVEVEPRRCQECHQTPPDLDSEFMPMIPLMNELTRPWPHWQAESAFPNHSFELPLHFVSTPAPGEKDLAPSFREILDSTVLSSVADFEPIIRRNQTHRVASARVKSRKAKAKADETFALVRPLFCAEQVNFVSEDRDSGFISTDAIISAGTREAFNSLGFNRQLGLASLWPNTICRGDRRAIAPNPSSRKRRPGGPEEACWTEGSLAVDSPSHTGIGLETADAFRISDVGYGAKRRAKLRSGDLVIAIGNDAKNVDILPDVIEKILDQAQPAIASQIKTVFADPTNKQVVALGYGWQPQDVQLLTVDQFGSALEEWADSIEAAGRASLSNIARERLCEVTRRFPNRPAFAPPNCKKVTTMSVPTTGTTTTRGETPDNYDPKLVASGISKTKKPITDNGTTQVELYS